MTQINITYEESRFCDPETAEWLKEHLKKKFEKIMGNCPLYIGDAWNIEVVSE
jgi:hypothetical protein